MMALALAFKSEIEARSEKESKEESKRPTKPFVLINWKPILEPRFFESLREQKKQPYIGLHSEVESPQEYKFCYHAGITKAFADPTCVAVLHTPDTHYIEEFGDSEDLECRNCCSHATSKQDPDCLGDECPYRCFICHKGQVEVYHGSAYLRMSLAKIDCFSLKQYKKFAECLNGNSDHEPSGDLFLEVRSPFVIDKDADVKEDGVIDDVNVINFHDAHQFLNTIYFARKDVSHFYLS
jgi:hypothetical protein